MPSEDVIKARAMQRKKLEDRKKRKSAKLLRKAAAKDKRSSLGKRPRPAQVVKPPVKGGLNKKPKTQPHRSPVRSNNHVSPKSQQLEHFSKKESLKVMLKAEPNVFKSGRFGYKSSLRRFAEVDGMRAAIQMNGNIVVVNPQRLSVESFMANAKTIRLNITAQPRDFGWHCRSRLNTEVNGTKVILDLTFNANVHLQQSNKSPSSSKAKPVHTRRPEIAQPLVGMTQSRRTTPALPGNATHTDGWGMDDNADDNDTTTTDGWGMDDNADDNDTTTTDGWGMDDNADHNAVQQEPAKRPLVQDSPPGVLREKTGPSYQGPGDVHTYPESNGSTYGGQAPRSDTSRTGDDYVDDYEEAAVPIESPVEPVRNSNSLQPVPPKSRTSACQMCGFYNVLQFIFSICVVVPFLLLLLYGPERTLEIGKVGAEYVPDNVLLLLKEASSIAVGSFTQLLEALGLSGKGANADEL